MIKKLFVGFVMVSVFGLSLSSIKYVCLANEMSVDSVTTSLTPGADIEVLPPYSPTDGFLNPFFGQDHYYSVTFRGNGQAVVFVRVAFSNSLEEQPVSQLEFRFPGVEPEGLMAYQVIREKQCLRYDYSKMLPDGQYTCLQYGEPDYSDYYYGVNTYKKAKTSLTTDTLTVELPNKISPQKSGSILLYYRAFGFAKKNFFGAYNYTFETLKVDDTIRNLRVGISPDSDLLMRGAKGNVDYFKESTPIIESSKAMAVGSSFRNSSVDSAIQNIGYGTVNKSSSNLMPLDSYKVKGSYADTFIKLYARTLLIALASVLVVATLLVIALRKVYKTFYKKPQQFEPSREQNFQKMGMWANIILCVVVSFVTAVTVCIMTFLSYFVLHMIQAWSYSGDILAALPVLSSIVSVGIVGGALFLPSILIGVKKGVWWGLSTFALTLFWLFLIVVVLGLIFMGHANAPVYGPVVGL